MKLIVKLLNFLNMKKIFDYNKEQYRGTLKQIMKVRGLRSISIANYNKWLKQNGLFTNDCPIHSLKLDIQDGYINAYAYGADGRCGVKIDDVNASTYKEALDAVNSIITNEYVIPYRVKRNIFVKMSR